MARGTPLIDVGSQLLRDQWVPHLERLRTQALEWRIEADLHEGRHQQLVPELQALTSVHPLREHFHGQLMLALYRCGRQAEALTAYTDARKALDVELGVEPGPGLRDLHQLILSGDPALAVTRPAQYAQAEPQQVTPRELPPGVPGFTGRSAELRALTRLLDRSGDPRGGAADDPLGKAAGEQAPGTVVISAIGGTAGVGKPNPGANTSNRYPGLVDPSIVIDPFAQLRAWDDPRATVQANGPDVEGRRLLCRVARRHRTHFISSVGRFHSMLDQVQQPPTRHCR